MSVTYGYFNSVDGDRVYNADQMSRYFDGLVSNGVYLNVGDAFKVVASGDGLSVNVKTGRGIIDCKWVNSDAVETIALNEADVSKPRYTAITLRLSYSDRLIALGFHDGSPASNPQKPEPLRTAENYELILAYVLVPAGATSISQAQIEDTRASKRLCGWVSGLIDQVDTDQLFDQFNTAYQDMLVQMSDWQARQQAQYEEWFSTLTQDLTVGCVAVEYKKTEVFAANSGSGKSVRLDMTGYTYREDDIIAVYINGLAAVQDVDYDFDVDGNTVIVNLLLVDVKSNPCTVEVKVLQSKASSGGGGGAMTSSFETIAEFITDSSESGQGTTSPNYQSV